MTSIAIDTSRPNASNVYNTDLDAIRNNIIWLQIAAAANHFSLPGWGSNVTGTGGDLSKPSLVTLTNNSNPNLKMEFRYGYSSDGKNNLTSQQWWYDKGLGAGWERVVEGTITYSYTDTDFTGSTSA